MTERTGFNPLEYVGPDVTAESADAEMREGFAEALKLTEEAVRDAPHDELEALADWLEMYCDRPLYDLLPPVGEVTGKSAAKMLRALRSETEQQDGGGRAPGSSAACVVDALGDIRNHTYFGGQGENDPGVLRGRLLVIQDKLTELIVLHSERPSPSTKGDSNG